jgi:ribonucleoside-diphosphate reductase alpha chain
MANIYDAPISRKHLPNRRRATTLTVEHGLPFTATFGHFADGKVGEVFLQNHKPGSQADSNARDSAVAASLALQYGCPLEVLRNALLRDSQGRPSTPLGAALDAIGEDGQ